MSETALQLTGIEKIYNRGQTGEVRVLRGIDLTLKAGDLEHYYGERGRRGAKLPRGFQNVDAMSVERKG